MRKLKKTLTILFLIFLSSCTTSDIDFKQRSAYFVYVTIDGKEYISVEESACFVRDYHKGIDYIGPKPGEVSEEPIKECDRMIGSNPEDYGRNLVFEEEIRRKLSKRSE